MTATAPATGKKQNQLPSFEDHDVQIAAVRITKCGDGLSEALKVQPKALDLGDEVSFVLTGKVGQISHKDKDGVVTRLHTVETTAITEVDTDTAKRMLVAAAEELQRRKDEIDGQMRLQMEKDAEERERSDHAATGSARNARTGAEPADVVQFRNGQKPAKK